MKKKSKKVFYNTLAATYQPAFGSVSRVVRRGFITKTNDLVKIKVKQDDISALDATKQEVDGFGVEYVTGLGWMITSVNGIAENPTTGQFWKYFVNGQFVETGADKYIVNKGDKIEWRLCSCS